MKNEGEQRNTYIVGTMEPLFGEKRTKGVNMKWAGEHRKEIVGIRARNQKENMYHTTCNITNVYNTNTCF